jgi:hypothetical protein
MRTTFLDLETTGLDPVRDEILEIGILDDGGEILLDSLVRPERDVRPARATGGDQRTDRSGDRAGDREDLPVTGSRRRSSHRRRQRTVVDRI